MACAAAFAGPGCGGDDDGSDADEAKRVRTAYTELQSRFAAKDSQGVCTRLSRAAREQVGSMGHEQPTTCVRDVRRLFKWIEAGGTGGSAPRPTVMRVAMDGDTATVTARLSDNASGPVRFAEEDGEWKLDSFFAITGPPAPDML